MDDSGSNNTLEGSSDQIIANNIKKPKKRSLVERELETNLTDRVISPVSNGDSLSRYGRARRSITNNESLNKELISLTMKTLSTEKSPNNEIATKLPLKSPESDRNVNKAAEDIIGMNKDNCIQSISTENLSLISFGSEVSTTSSPMKKSAKVYVRKDLMQQKDGKIGKIMKNIFSPIKSPSKKSNSHLNNVLERSEKYELDSNEKRKVANGYIDTSSVVKNLDFDTGKGKKKDVIPEQNEFLSKSDLFDQESKCVYQVGDMAWARVGSYPFWPCFVTRDPFSGIFVKKKLFGRIERDVIHVTFLGDNGRRGWIVENMLRKYSGIEEFENTKKELNHEFKKKDPRLYAAFFVSEKQMPKWKISVDEAEILLNEPKRLRLNIFNDMLVISRSEKSGTPCRPKSSKICRTDSDVSLSESLYDSLFSEDDCKNDDLESRNRSKNRSLDVSEVVTACLDNMAAKTGMAKIQKQSHMDIWLQKAKSQTPEKNKTVVTKKNKVSKIHKKKSNINKLTPSKDISKKSERSSPRKHSNSKLTDEIKEHSCSKSADCSGAKISKIKTENSKTEPHDTVEIMDDKKKTSFFDYKESSDISNDYGRDNTKKELTDANFKTRSAKDKSLTSSFNTSDMNIEIKPDDFNTKYDKMIDTVSLQRKDPGILNTSSQDTDISMVPIKTLADIENKKKFNTKQKKLNTLSKLLKPRDVQHSIPREKLLNEHQANLIVKPKVTKKQSKKLCKKVNTFDYLNSVPGTSSSSKPFIPYVNESSEKNQQNISKQDIPLIEDDQSEVSIIQKVSEKEMFVSSDDTLQSFNISFEESETCIVSDKEKARSKNQTKFNSKEFKGKTERTRKNEKISMSLRSDPIKEVAFLNFLELRKDLFMDQYPELSENEIAEYIYKVWLYENESPNDVIIEDEKCDVISGLITQDVDHNTHISEPNTKKDTIKSTIKDYFTPESSSSSVSLAKNEVSDIDSNLQPCDISKNKTVSISYNSNQMPSNVCIDANAGIKDSVKENQPSFDSLATDDTALNDTDSGSEILNVVTNKLNNIVNEHGLKVNDDNLARNESVLVPNKLVNGKDVRPESSRKEAIVNNTNAGKNVAVIDNEKKMTDQTIMVKLSNGGIHNSDENDMEDVNVCQIKSSTKAYSATSPLRVAKMDEIINDEMVNHNNVSLSGTKSCALEDKTNDIIELCGKSDNHIEASKNKMTKMTNCELVSNRLANGDVTRDTLDKSCNDFKYPSTNEKKSAKVSNLLNENGDCISVTKNKESGPEECVNGEIVTHNNVKRLANSFKTDIVAVEYERSKKSPLRKLRLNRQRNRVETHNDHSNHYDIKHPEFVEYIELKRDALLDENPNFTQDMITSYLYKTWLYEKEIKSRENGKTKLDYNDRKEVYELTEIIKCKESVDSLMDSDDFESNIDSISNTADEEICSKKSISCCNGVREIFSTRIPKVVLKNIDLSKKLQEISAVKENFELTDFDKFHSSSKALLEEDIKNTKSDLVMKEVKVKLQDFVLNQRQNSCETTDPLDKFRAFQQGAISESIKFDSDNSLEGSELHPSLNNPSAKEMKNPKFLEYAELKRDYVLDENPELTDDLVLAYLYKTWLYEQGEKTNEIKDDFDHANEVQGIDEEITHENSDEETNAKNINSEINMSTNISDHESQGASERSQTVDDEEDSSDNDVLDSIRTETPTNETSKVNSSDSTNADEDADLSIVKDEPVHLKENDKNKDSPSSCRDESENQITTNKDFMTELDRSDNSEISNKSEQIITRKSKNKQKQAKSKDFDNLYDHPEFTKYIERRQGPLMDENPNISPDDVISYLYKSWLYEQSDKPDKLISDEVDNLEIIKDFDKKPSLTPKKIRKRDKVKKEKCVYEDDQFDAQDLIPKEKPKRKTVKPYYNEEEDFENEIAIFEIFKKKPKKPTESMKSTAMIKEELKVEPKEAEPPEQVINNNGAVEIVDAIECEDKVYDMEEYYFSQLTDPKPNIFKGLTREKVCEICEKPSCLVKCKGPCCGMFHIDCVKRESKPFIAPTPSRGRKKKNQRGPKPRGRDNSNSFNGSYSDEKSQGNISDDNLNISIDEKSDIEPYMIIDLDEFETQMEAKMKEMLLKAEENVIFDLTGCDDETAWKNTVPGQCEIVDVKLNLKEAEEMPGFDNFKCNHCQKHGRPLCFICKSTKSPKKLLDHRQRCQFAHCHKFYHLECLESWPQTQFNSGEPTKKIGEHFEALTCPRHVCHTCVSDDPRGCKTRFSGDKLARCVRCPATYHSFTKCLPAGSQILSASHIICPRHTDPKPGKVPCHVNTGWCFICALGGTLICCEYCPTSFHAECLNIKPPEGNYMCEDCETGRLPLYGEMVWVKLGHYRWWPGLILHPSEIPNNLRLMKHSMGEFVVRFFGQYDHYWVNRGRVFPFQEGDSGRVSNQKSKIDEAFSKAMEHAQRACEILKTASPGASEDPDIASSLLPPHYVKLKVNKPRGQLAGRRADDEANSFAQCECDAGAPDPCGPASQCLNRMLLTECGPQCHTGERCNNRAFEKRQYPKLTAYRTPHRGWGLKTLEDIQQGQFVIEYVGELIDEEEFRRRMRRMHEVRDENFYFLTLDKDRMIDAGPKGNLARFMNHCCEPNCETQKWTVLGDVRVGLFALRDIPANSEVTFNYNLECAGIEKKRCLCGAKRCSGYIGAKPKEEPKIKKSVGRPSSAKRPYKKKKPAELSPTTVKPKNKPRTSKTSSKPKELSEIEKDLLIIKNATILISSDSECSGRLSSLDSQENLKEMQKSLKRKLDMSEESKDIDSDSPLAKKVKSNIGNSDVA